MFDFKFPAAGLEEGAALAEAVGHDMPPLAGCEGYEIIQDVADLGHVMVNTQWASQEMANTALSHYQHDAKIKRATELMGAPSPGFVGNIRVKV